MKTVFLDVDTQYDFVSPAGALYVPGAERLVDTIAALNERAPLVISTVDAHAEDDPEFALYGRHCVRGTLGQLKPPRTLLSRRVVLGGGEAPEAPQIIVEKQKLDAFTNPALRPFLQALRAERFVVYGVVTEICVRCAVGGLLTLGKPVEIVTDAVRALDEPAAQEMLRNFQASGVRLVTAASV